MIGLSQTEVEFFINDFVRHGERLVNRAQYLRRAAQRIIRLNLMFEVFSSR